MTATGIVRKLDKLGRIVIPKELCRTYDMPPKTPLEIFVAGDGDIMLRKHVVKCAICGGENSRSVLNAYKEALLCNDCYAKMN